MIIIKQYKQALQLSSQVSGQQAEVCYTSATVVADFAKESRGVAAQVVGNGVSQEHQDPLGIPRAFPHLPLVCFYSYF